MAELKSGSRTPWVGFAAAVWVQIAAGTAYTFPLFSHSLKSVLGFNQQQLTMLGVANDIGENIGLLPGTVCNYLPPWAVLSIGAITCFFGYTVLWLAVSQIISLPYWVLWISLCMATNSNTWFGTGVLVTNMRNFPLSRGTVAGILKGYVGLSAAVYTEIFTGVLKNSSSKLLLFLSVGIPALSLVMVYFIRPCNPSSEENSADHGHFLFIQAASVVLGIYLLATMILDKVLYLNTSTSYIFVCLMVLLLLAPLAVPLKMKMYPSNNKKIGILDQSTSAEQLTSGELSSEKSDPLLNKSAPTVDIGGFQEGDNIFDVGMLLAEGEDAVKKKRKPKRGEDFELFEAFVKADFWLLFVVYFLGVGSGVTVLNNLAQIGIAEGVNDTTVLLSLFSFCNFIGRLGGGVVSEYFVRLKCIPRTVWMTFTQIIMIIAYLLFTLFLNGTLYIATALLGICYGVQFSIMVPTASELFGLKHFGVIYNFMMIGNPLGALLFSGLLAGYVYDREAEKQNSLMIGIHASCLGPNCFRLTFLILAGVCGLGTVLSLILTAPNHPTKFEPDQLIEALNILQMDWKLTQAEACGTLYSEVLVDEITAS